jgi:micrococcal nuclease
VAAGYEPCLVCRPPTLPPSTPTTPRAPAPSPASPAPRTSPLRELAGNVVGVHDGDTITVLVGRTQHKIRLNGIDAPELAQAWGRRSRETLSALVFGKTVRVVVMDVDRYDREVGDVYVGAVLANAEMLRAGMAWWYRQYSRNATLAVLEAGARAQRRGLWADADPVPPWQYRRG